MHLSNTANSNIKSSFSDWQILVSQVSFSHYISAMKVYRCSTPSWPSQNFTALASYSRSCYYMLFFMNHLKECIFSLLYTANMKLSCHSKCADNKQCPRNETQLSVACVALSTCLNCALASFWQHRYHERFQVDECNENSWCCILFKQGYSFVLHYQAKLSNS